MFVWTCLVATALSASVSAPITFAPGNPSATNTTLTASPNTVVADGSAVITLRVVVRDAFNNLVPAASVSLAGSGGNNVFAAATGQTDPNGVYSTNLSSTQVQSETITATIAGSLSKSAPVTFTVGPASAATSTLSVSPASQIANNSNVITATLTLKDAQAHPISGQTPSFTASGGATTVSASSATNAAGQSSATYASTLAQNENAQVSVAGLNLYAPMTFVAGPAVTANSSLVASPNTLIANGTASTSLTVTARDAQGNVVPSASVSLAGSGGNNVFAQASGTTNASGVLGTTLTSTQVQTETITATIGGNAAPTATVTFSVGPASSTKSLWTVSPATQTANNTSIITATLTLKDAQAHPIAGVTPSFSYSGSNTTATGAAATNASGVSTVTYKSTLAQSENALAAAGGINLSAAMTFVPGAVAAAQSSISASPSSVAANGSTKSTVTVHLADAYNNNIGNQQVIYSVGGGAGPLTSRATTTNTAGSTTNTVVSRTSGVAPVFAYAQGITLNTNVTYTATTPYCTGTPSYGLSGTTNLNSPTCLVLADFDGDGHLDIAFSNNGNTVVMYRGSGNNTYYAPVTSSAGGCNSAVAADFNADGKADLFWSNSAYNVSVMLSNGSGGFSNTTYSTIAGTTAVAADDMNNDGSIDFLIGAIFAYNIGIAPNDGAGNLGTVTTVPTTGTTYSLATGDFNADGRRDVAVSVNSNNVVNILLAQSGGGYANAVSYAAGSGAQDIFIDDFNSDGRQDLALSTTGENAVSVFLGTGSGTFQARITYAVGAGANHLIKGDYNGDGKADIIALNGTDGTYSLLLNSGTGSFGAQKVYSTQAQPISGTSGDLNEDGQTDFAFATGSSNAILEYVYNGCN